MPRVKLFRIVIVGTSISKDSISMAWIDKPEASLFRCDGLDSARKVLIARSATKLTWRKQLGPPKGQDINSFFPLHATTSREKRE